MSSDIHSVLVGETWRKAGMVAKASGSAITSGTCNYYLKALSGANAGKWWKNSDQTWDAAETANAMTHQADGSWTINLAATPFADGILYLEYAKESGDLHVAGEGRLLRGKAVLDSVSLGAILGTALSETSGQLAGRFKDFFDQASATFNVATSLASFKADVSALATAAKLLAYVQLLARKDAAIAADRATELGEINADQGSGAGGFANTSDSQEAIRDTEPLGTAMRGTDGANTVVPDAAGTAASLIAALNNLSQAQAETACDAALASVGATLARMGYLDWLNIGGNVASSAEVTAVQNNTRCVRVVPAVIERPDAGADPVPYRIELLLYDAVGNMEAPDAAPTIALVDQAGTDLSGRLDSTTMALVSAGRYRAVYTAASTDDLEQLVWAFSVIEGGNTRVYGNTSLIVDTTAVDFTAADRTKLEGVFNKLPSKAYLTGTANADGDVQLDEATGTPADPAGVGTLLTRLPQALVFTGADVRATLDGETVAVSDKTGYKLALDGLDLIVVETGINARQTLALLGAALAGKISGADENAVVIKGMNNDTTRISATTNAAGRSAVTLSPPA